MCFVTKRKTNLSYMSWPTIASKREFFTFFWWVAYSESILVFDQIGNQSTKYIKISWRQIWKILSFFPVKRNQWPLTAAYNTYLFRQNDFWESYRKLSLLIMNVLWCNRKWKSFYFLFRQIWNCSCNWRATHTQLGP